MQVLLPDESLRIAPNSGIGRYTAELIRGLKNHRDIDSLLTFRRGSVAFQEPDTIPCHRDHGRSTAFRHYLVENSSFAYRAYDILRTRYYKGLLRNYRSYIYHEPNFILKPHEGYKVATIHDFSFIKFPECHPRLRVRFLNDNIEKTIVSADRIIVDSDFIKHELLSMFPVSGDRVITVALGVDQGFAPKSEAEVQHVLDAYELSYRQFFLIVGALDPRKNLGRTLQAYCRLPVYIQRHFPVVVVGHPGWCKIVFDKATEHQIANGNIRFVGGVTDSVLKALYASAQAVLYFSLYEGFGLPALEALASGTPILTSSKSAMVELCGPYGMFASPHSLDEMSDAMRRSVDLDQVRAEVSSGMVAYAQSFSWENTVNSTVSVYKRVV